MKCYLGQGWEFKLTQDSLKPSALSQSTAFIFTAKNSFRWQEEMDKDTYQRQGRAVALRTSCLIPWGRVTIPLGLWHHEPKKGDLSCHVTMVYSWRKWTQEGYQESLTVHCCCFTQGFVPSLKGISFEVTSLTSYGTTCFGSSMDTSRLFFIQCVLSARKQQSPEPDTY